MNCESSDQRQRHALELVILDELVQIDREQFEGDDQVVAEHTMILDLNYVVLVVWVLFLQVLENVQFNACLVLVTLFVLNDFHGDNFVCFVV